MSGYRRKSEKELSNDEYRAVINYLALPPEAGDLMQGTVAFVNSAGAVVVPEKAVVCV